jgi:DNA-binding NarL/FixJ family response regulator
MDQPLRILFLDDDAGEAERLTLELQLTGMNAVHQRVDARDAFILALRDFAPDLVLSRYATGSFTAPEAIGIVRTMRPSAAFIVLSDALDEAALIACMRAGADDIVPVDHPEQLPATIAAAVSLRRPLEGLTPRQLHILRLIASGNSTPQIARALGLSAKTVDSHRSQVMKRLGLHDVVALVRYAVRVGLVSAESRGI